MPPIDDSSVFSALGSGIASGFGTVANVLDTPFAFGRDILSGKNPLPGLFMPERRTTTREFFGIDDNPDSWMDEIADIGLSIAFDPVTYLTLGGSALSKSGAVLKKAGLLDDLVKVASRKAGKDVGKRVARLTTTPLDVLESLAPAQRAEAFNRARDAAAGLGIKDLDALLAREGNKPIGGLVGGGLPLVSDRINFGAFGTGKRSQQVAAAMDLLGEKVRWSAPGRAAAQLFDKTSGNFYGEAEQRASQDLWKLAETARHEARERSYQVLKRYDTIRTGGQMPPDQLDDVLAFAVERKEGVPISPAVAPTATIYDNLAPEVRGAVDDVVGLMRGETGSVKQSFDDIGLKLPELFDEYVEYAPRYVADFYKRQSQRRALFDTYFPSQQARESILRNIPDGRTALNKMLGDPQLVGPNKSPNAAMILNALYGVADEKQAGKLADFLSKLPDEALGESLYGNPVENVMRYMEGGIETAKTASYLQEYLAPFAKSVDEAVTPSGARVPFMITNKMRAELKKAGFSAEDIGAMKPAEAWEALGKYKKTETVESVLRKAGFTKGGAWEIGEDGTRQYVGGSSDINPAAAQRMAQLIGVANPDDALKMVLPEDVAQFVVKTMEPYTKPASSIPIVQATDYFLNTFKGLATGPFLAFHGRNFGSGAFRNVQLGAFNAADTKRIDGLLRYGKAIPGVHEIPVIKRMLGERGLEATAENGTELFKELSYVYEISGGHVATPADVMSSTADAFATQVPGRVPFSYKEAAKTYFQRKREAWNPFAVRGGYDPFAGSWVPFKAGEAVEASRFGPAKAGEMLGEHVEALNRNQAFLTLLRKGDAPGVAAAKVTAAHGSYAGRNFTWVENEIFRRLAPFFKFSRNQTEWLVRELMERPGGRLAKTIRIVAATQQQDPFAPDYIKRGASIPLAPGPSGEPRYLAGLGVMEEDPLSFAGGGAGMELLSRLNPLIKGPMEAVLNQSFFQVGRPMSSLDPPIGRTLANVSGRDKPVEWLGGLTRPTEQLISNIVPRPFTTLRTLTDTRKELGVRLLNTTTGLRIVDVPEAARDQVVRRIAQDLLEQFPDTKRKVTTYIPVEDLEAMAPAEREEAQRLLDLLKALDQRGKARAEKRAQAG